MNTTSLRVDETTKVVVIVLIKEDDIAKIAEKIKEQINLIEINYYAINKTIRQESSVFKIAFNSVLNTSDIQTIIDKNQAGIIEIKPSFLVIEKTGKFKDIMKFYNEISPYGIINFNIN